MTPVTAGVQTRHGGVDDGRHNARHVGDDFDCHSATNRNKLCRNPACTGGPGNGGADVAASESKTRQAPLADLSREERLLLMEFVCSFAWADLEVKPEERDLVAKLIRRLELDDDDAEQVNQWLDTPPPLDDLDPARVPRAHRVKFLRAVESMVTVDGEVSPEERESLIIFAQLIH